MFRCSPEDVAEARERRRQLGRGVDADPHGFARMPRDELEQLCREFDGEAEDYLRDKFALKAEIAAVRDVVRGTNYVDADVGSIVDVVQSLIAEMRHLEREQDESHQYWLKYKKSIEAAAQAATTKR